MRPDIIRSPANGLQAFGGLVKADNAGGIMVIDSPSLVSDPVLPGPAPAQTLVFPPGGRPRESLLSSPLSPIPGQGLAAAP